MSMDIASSAPSAPSTASGGPPGAGPPTPASGTQEFAALLTRQGAPPAKRAPGAGPKSPGEGPETAKAASPSDPNTADPAAGEQARETVPGKHGAKDAIDTSADLGISLLVQTVPPEAVALAVPVHAGMPFPLSPPSGAGAAGQAIPGAMDTSLASAPATRGATPLQPGGELLPHTDIPAAVTASATPGLFALPAPAQAHAAVPAPGAKASAGQAGQVGTAQGAAGVLLLPEGAGAGSMSAAHGATAQASPAPASSPATPLDASASTKLAVQEYAQLGQAALQKSARPANNTSIGTGTAALQAAQGPGKGGVQAGLAQGTAGTANPAPAEKTAGQDGARSAGASTSADSSQAGQQAGAGAGLFSLPSPVQAEGAKPAAAPLAPQTPADRAALMQQAADSVRALHTQVLGHGRGQMTLQLHPQDWGKLQVSVSMMPAGTAGGGTTVVAHVVADSAAVKQALESGGADLHRTLREAGLHLERLTITIRPGGASTEAQGMGAQAGGGRNPSPDPQASATPGSRSDANTGMPGVGGQALSGGGGGQAGSRSPERGQAMRLDPRAPDDHQGDARIAAPAMHATGRLDTRA